MKYALCALLAAASLGAAGQAPRLQKLWETDSVLATPESVLHHRGRLFVSLINGQPWAADGKGGIAVLSPDGRILDTSFTTGLHAPKGMGVHKKRLYVADMSEVAVIHAKRGSILQRIAVPGAENLNDITIGEGGTLYVSDSKKGNVHRLRNGKAETLITGLSGVNGLLFHEGALYVLTRDRMLKAGPEGAYTVVAPLEQGGDGIEHAGGGAYVVSAWQGYIHLVGPDGTKTLLLDTHNERNRQTADIGYDPKTATLFVPTFFGRSVTAYRLVR